MDKRKPKLTVNDQIEHSQKKGIKFERCSVHVAQEYLQKNNNYFKLTAYRKNFQKHADGEQAGKYINLDFAYLIDLAVIDMELRYLLVHIALDVEHYAKMQLIKCVETSDSEDGYTIVQDYFDSLEKEQKELLEGELKRNKKNIYCGELARKYDGHYPIWAFVETIPFGRLISFYKFCAERFDNKVMKNNYFRLLTCKEIRNASAHSNCILNDLKAGTAMYKTNNAVSCELMKIEGITKEIRTRKMSNARVQQIITLLYMHKLMVTSQSVHERESRKLQEFVERMFLHIDYYKGNNLITTTFDFLKLVVDNWFSVTYNSTT